MGKWMQWKRWYIWKPFSLKEHQNSRELSDCSIVYHVDFRSRNIRTFHRKMNKKQNWDQEDFRSKVAHHAWVGQKSVTSSGGYSSKGRDPLELGWMTDAAFWTRKWLRILLCKTSPHVIWGRNWDFIDQEICCQNIKNHYYSPYPFRNLVYDLSGDHAIPCLPG